MLLLPLSLVLGISTFFSPSIYLEYPSFWQDTACRCLHLKISSLPLILCTQAENLPLRHWPTLYLSLLSNCTVVICPRGEASLPDCELLTSKNCVWFICFPSTKPNAKRTGKTPNSSWKFCISHRINKSPTNMTTKPRPKWKTGGGNASAPLSACSSKKKKNAN